MVSSWHLECIESFRGCECLLMVECKLFANIYAQESFDGTINGKFQIIVNRRISAKVAYIDNIPLSLTWMLLKAAG
jgi:hypothetical protein